MHISYIMKTYFLLLLRKNKAAFFRNGYIKRFSYNCTQFGRKGVVLRKADGRRENSITSSIPSSVI